ETERAKADLRFEELKVELAEPRARLGDLVAGRGDDDELAVVFDEHAELARELAVGLAPDGDSREHALGIARRFLRRWGVRSVILCRARRCHAGRDHSQADESRQQEPGGEYSVHYFGPWMV